MKTNPARRTFLAAGLAASLPGAAPAGPQYRQLGKTGLKVTTLGFGCMLVSDASVVAKALDMGINFFDTARSYQGGNNERMVGAVLKGKRKEVVLESKSLAKTKEAALADLETSLRELGTDYLDVWYLHAKGQPEEVTPDLLEAQRTAKQQGKIRFAGVSTHANMKALVPWLVKQGQTDVILTAYNFTMGPEMEMEQTIRSAREAGVGIVAMKVMAGGFARIKRGDRLYGADPKALAERLQKEGAMPTALKWVLRNRSVDTAIIGITDMDQLDENYAAMSAPFTDADQKMLTARLESIRPLYCRMCGACAGQCPRGLPVSDMLRVLSYADGYGQFPLARERFRELPAAAASARCRDCSTCSVQCPNGVRVAERLALAQEWLA